MADLASPGLPRIALVFGEASAATGVREAVSGCVDIVYTASAGDFDGARLVGAQVAAALVNLDGDGDWLDGIEAQLNDAEVAVVYNDPEDSDRLEGWERARWLRHLVAKLRGSNDVDPPRPQAAVPQAVSEPPADAGVEVLPEAAAVSGMAAPQVSGAGVGRPLSPEEIENMTADFVADVDPVSSNRVSTQPAQPAPCENAQLPAQPEPMTATAADFDAEGALDVDTETLSAMIDARLAEPSAQSSSESPEVWRVVSGDVTPPVQSGMPASVGPVGPDTATAVAPAVQDDADVLASLPALDDWQLLDPDTVSVAPAANVERNAPEPTLPDSLAGLELVPMETIVSVRTNTDPIERWLDDSKPAKPVAKTANAARAGAGGGKS